MKRLLGLFLFGLIAIGCFADRVKGELRTEINGFQWYNHNNREAYTIDGRKLFADIQNIKGISFSAIDKDDKGVFIVERGKKYVGLVSDVYTKDGELLYHFGTYILKRIAIEYTNPYRKEYYIQFTNKDHSGIHGIKGFGKTVAGMLNSYTIKGNYILYKRLGDHHNVIVRYDGTEIIDGYHSIKFDKDLIIVSTSEGTGLFSLSGNWIIKPIKNYYDYSVVNLNSNLFYLVKYKNSSQYQYRLISPNGIDVLGREYDALEAYGSEYVKVKRNGFYGISTLEGKEIISTSRGYTNIGDFNSTNKTFAFTKKGYSGICNEQGEEISLNKLPPVADDIIEKGDYASAVELVNGNTKYWKVSKGGRYGLTDAKGKVIVPTEMEALESAGTGYLRYKLNGFWGLMNYAGKIIIDTDRGYTSIGDFKTFNKRFPYTMTGYKGECDINGRQISKIKVETPSQQQVVEKKEDQPQRQDEKKIIIEHKHDPVPMQVWKQCTICYGSGKCQTCGGSGIYTGAAGNSTLCTFGCGGSGKCSFCAGQGGHYEVEYR